MGTSPTKTARSEIGDRGQMPGPRTQASSPGLIAGASPPASSSRRSRSAFKRRAYLSYALVLPLMSAIGFLSIYPAVRTLVDSFYHVDPLTRAHGFAGLGNYRVLVHDPTFTSSLFNTLFYVIFGTVLLTLAGLGMALALRRPFRGRAVVIAIVVLPWALPGVVEGIIWTWTYDPTFGVLNYSLVFAHILRHFIVLIGQNRMLTIALTELVQVWQLAPLSCLLILSSLQAVPHELYEASGIDGATRWHAFRWITLPLIRPGLAIAIVQSSIASFTIFDIAYAITGGTGPTATRPVMAGIYAIAFQNENFGEAYAGVFAISAILMLGSAAVLRLVYRKVEF